MKFLSVNAGSSSLKFQVYEMPEEKVLISGYVEKIGLPDCFWTVKVNGEKIKTVEPDISGDFETIMNWADEVRKLQIRTNADTPRDALQARKFGAEGIGLCRTEHMFFEEERIFNFLCKVMFGKSWNNTFFYFL